MQEPRTPAAAGKVARNPRFLQNLRRSPRGNPVTFFPVTPAGQDGKRILFERQSLHLVAKSRIAAPLSFKTKPQVAWSTGRSPGSPPRPWESGNDFCSSKASDFFSPFLSPLTLPVKDSRPPKLAKYRAFMSSVHLALNKPLYCVNNNEVKLRSCQRCDFWIFIFKKPRLEFCLIAWQRVHSHLFVCF